MVKRAMKKLINKYADSTQGSFIHRNYRVSICAGGFGLPVNKHINILPSEDDEQSKLEFITLESLSRIIDTIRV